MNYNCKLEHFEWVNIWHDNTLLSPEEEAASRRVLFVGDSITNGMRQFLPAMLRENFTATPLNVDFMTTSKGIDNPDLIRELEYMTKDLEYDYIQFNNCLHGFSVNEEDYERYYGEVVGMLIKRVGNGKLALMLGTPHTVKGNPAELSELNNRVKARNEAVRRIAEKNALPVNDLYSVVVGNAEIRSDDGYHYKAEGYELLADKCSDFIVGKLK